MYLNIYVLSSVYLNIREEILEFAHPPNPMRFGGIYFGGWRKKLNLAGINFGGLGKFLYLAGINFGGRQE